MSAGAWTPELDKKIAECVRVCVPASCYDDAFQEARVAVLEAEGGQKEVYYLTRAIWAARNWARSESRQAVPMDMEALARRVAAGERV